MPRQKTSKATARAKPKNKKKKAADEEEEVQDLPQPPSPVDDEDQPDQPDQPSDVDVDVDGSSGDDEEEAAKSKEKVPELAPAVEQELAEFYEEHPMFYDKSRSDYKNSKKKDRLLQERATALNLTGEFYSNYFILPFYCSIV